MRQRILKALLASATALLTACSGYESTPTTPNPTPAPTATPAGGTATVDFTGTTRALGPTSCGGDSHQFVAAEGTITVLLVRTTGNASLVAQVCAGGIDDNDCSLKQTVIAVGQTLTAVRKGASGQTLKLLPRNCGPQPQPPPAASIDYAVTVTYQR